MKITVVVNTYNEEKNLGRCLSSVKDFADEIVVVDMHSTDKTTAIAKKYKAKIFQHDYTRFVELARNFALSKATGDWIFLIDADEELSAGLAEDLKKIASGDTADFVEIPRKNIIFNKWIRHSRWWPDFVIRFFKKGRVLFSEEIHRPPQASGRGKRLEAREENALIHYNFQSVSQYLERINRYTDIQADELFKAGYQVEWEDLITKPADEFWSRFFAGEGYKDGLHGLALACLQAFSELVLYLKLWEKTDFIEKDISGFKKVFLKTFSDCLYWQGTLSTRFLEKLRFKLKSKI